MGTSHHRLVVVNPNALSAFAPGDPDPISDEHFYITSRRRAHHPWIAQTGDGPHARPDLEMDGQRLALPSGRVEDGEVQIRVIDQPAPITAVTCDIGDVLIPEGDTDLHLDGTAFSSGMWTVESDAPLTSAPAIHWGVNADGPQLGTFALFGWTDPGDWVRSTWIVAVLDGTEGGGAAWTPGQIVGFRFRVNWTLDTGGGNVFVEIEGQPGATRVSGPTPSFNFWDMPPDPLNNQVDLTVFTRADANGEVTVRLGAENMFPSFNLVVGFTDLEVVSCTEGLVSIDTEKYVTASLADASARQQLLGRLAYIEESTDEGMTWGRVLYAGYVQGIRMERNLTFLFQLGDTRRAERVNRAWTGFSPFDDPWLQHFTEVVGGVHKGFTPHAPELGYRRYEVTANYTDPAGAELPAIRIDWRGGAQTDVINAVAARTTNYYVDRRWPYSNPDIQGQFPGLGWYLLDPGTEAVVAGPLLPMGNAGAPSIRVFGNTISDPQLGDIVRIGTHYLQWEDHSPPSNGTEYLAVLVSREPSDAFPLYIRAHPVDLLTSLFTLKSIPFDAATATTCKAAMGAALRHEQDLTEGDETLQDLIDRLQASYQFVVRRGHDGINEFVFWGDKLAGLPADTVGINELREEAGPTFLLEQPSRVNRVQLRAESLAPWNGYRTETVREPRRVLGFIPWGTKKRTVIANRTEKPASGIVATEAPGTFNHSLDGVTFDADTYGVAEVSVPLEGIPVWPDGTRMNLVQWGDGLARKIFDRHARGRQACTVHLIRGTDAEGLGIGDALTLNLPHLPNAQLGQSPTSQRGGPRPFRIVQETPELLGPSLACVDEGTGVQYGTPPVIDTLTVVRASNAALTLQARISPAATLKADGAQVEFQAAVFMPGDTIDLTANGVSIYVANAAEWGATDPWPVRLEDFPPSATVFIRVRAWLFGGAATDWSNWFGLGGAVTGPQTTLSDLRITAVTDTGAQLDWSYDESPQVGDVLVQYRLTGGGGYTLFSTLPPGTETETLTGLSADTSYDVRLVLDNGGEYGDVLLGVFQTTGGSISNLVVGTPTSSSVALSWTNTHNTARVRVQRRLNGTTTWQHVVDLSAGSINYTLTGLTAETDYDVRIVLVIGGVEIGAALTDSFTTDLAANQLQIATPTVELGFTNGAGLYGIHVRAATTPLHQEIVVEEAVETSAGSNTPGTYAVVATIPAVIGGRTTYTATAPNDGLDRFLRVYATATGYTDSATTAAVQLDPWGAPVTVPDADLYLDELIDVTVPSPAHGDVLWFDDSSGEWVNRALHLDDLADVDAPAPNDGDVLTWEDSSGEWVPTPGGGVSDGDKGDITVSGSGSIWTIDPRAVTFPKIQAIATDRILGRDTAGSGDIEELTAAEVLALLGAPFTPGSGALPYMAPYWEAIDDPVNDNFREGDGAGGMDTSGTRSNPAGGNAWTAENSPTVDDVSNGRAWITSAASASIQIRGFYQAVPSGSTWCVRLALTMRPIATDTSQKSVGLYLRDSTAGKIEWWSIGYSGGGTIVWATKMTNATTHSAVRATTGVGNTNLPTFLEIENDGTNYILRYGWADQPAVRLTSFTHTDFLDAAADGIGVFSHNSVSVATTLVAKAIYRVPVSEVL